MKMRDNQHRSREYWREHDENIARLAAAVLDDNAERQRLQDMCEDAGLVFCLPSLNPYSGE
jgi:hypothetical protein